MIVTPICHHSLVQKSIILSKKDAISLHVHCKNVGEWAHLSVDGQTTLDVREGDRVEIKASSRQFIMIRNSKRNYFQVLKEKFGWQI